MYNPPRFRAEDWKEAFDLMDQNPFATLISVVDGSSFISHLPLTPRWAGDKMRLIGHMARANPQWRSLSNLQVTAVFHGPHTYITPMWYAQDDVPTWNYSVVHAKGAISLIESYDGLVENLKELTAHVERIWPSGWKFNIPEDLVGDKLTKSIVGFQIEVEEINFKKKLSQNRSALDRATVIKGLESRSDDNSRLVMLEMKKLS